MLATALEHPCPGHSGRLLPPFSPPCRRGNPGRVSIFPGKQKTFPVYPGAWVRTTDVKMVWEAERPLPMGKTIGTQLNRPECPPHARHWAGRGGGWGGETTKLAKTQSFHSRNREGERRETDEPARSGVFLPCGRQPSALAWEGAVRGMAGQQGQRLAIYRGTEQLGKQRE